MKKSFTLLSLLIIISALSVHIHAQNKALILIDIQEFYFQGGEVPLENPEAAALNAGLLLEKFRRTGDLVIHIRHNQDPGGAFHEYVTPASHEIVISKDQVNVFRDTILDEYLKEHEISDLVICGMQTHMCLEAAVRAGSDLGYSISVIADACATRALQYGESIIAADDVQHSTLVTLKSYARIISSTEYLIETAGD